MACQLSSSAVSLASALSVAMPSVADTWSVPDDFMTIQAAIDAAADGDTVCVADGTYTGAGNRDMDFGGKAITLRSANGAASCTIDIEASDVDPHRAFWFHNGETAASVVEGFTIRNGFMSRGGAVLCEASPVFQACVFHQNMACTEFSTDGGGAVYITGTPTFIECQFLTNHVEVNAAGAGGGAVRYHSNNEAAGGCCATSFSGFSDCLFIGNTATGRQVAVGGAIVTGRLSVELSRCRFEGNRADAGGAIAVHSNGATLDRCAFHDNVASSGGGGALRLSGGLPPFSAYVVGCEFVGNVAASNGGAVCAGFRGGTTIINSLFLGNQAGGGGGGLSLAILVGFHADIANSTFWGNEASSGGALRFVGTDYGDAGTAAVANSILWGNSPAQIDQVDEGLTVTYSDVQGGWPGMGNLALDPLFVDPSRGDYRLSPGSPCTDAGDNMAVLADELDLDGDGDVTEPIPIDLDGLSRFVDDPDTRDSGIGDPPIVDMGAYEFQPPCPGNTNDDGVVDVNDLNNVILDWGTDGSANGGDVSGPLPGDPPDGNVDFNDLNAVIVGWGACP